MQGRIQIRISQGKKMAGLIGAIDQGTTSTRFVIATPSGDIRAVHQLEHKQIFPKPGWVEHDAREIWRNTQGVIETALLKLGKDAGALAAIGVTNQRETTLVWDRKTGEPLSPAIVWMDVRTQSYIDRLLSHGSTEWVRAKTGLPLATYFSAGKLAWILDTAPTARAKAERGEALFGTMDSWLIWNLTGGVNGGRHLTDVTNASRTLLMDLTTLQWDRELLEFFNIPQNCLPEICASSEIYGSCVGLLSGVPIAAALGDQQASLFGQACLSPGEAKNTYGTGCFLLMNTGDKPHMSRHGLLTTVAYQLSEQKPVYALEGSIAIGGALIQWLRDNLGLIEHTHQIEALAQTVADNGDVYFVPAFSGLYAPYWRNDARGVIAGLTLYSNKGHIARAALEAIAYQTDDALAAMVVDSQLAIKQLKVDGGMAANNLLMQFQADILNAPVVRSSVLETTALGVAYAAGLAVGVIKGVDDIRSHWRADRCFEPMMDLNSRQCLQASWKKAVWRSFGWIS